MTRVAQCLIGVCLIGFGFLAHADSVDLFKRVESLIANGAAQLALRILDNGQPPVEQTDSWIRAEQLRFAIYREQGEWDALSGRLDAIPAELPLIQQHRVLTHAVETFLRAGRGDKSRKYLRDLLWTGSGDSVQISYWRRLLIRGYLVEGQLLDAQIAMDRYQKDYAPSDQNWSYLYGLTLLKSGMYEQAASQLSSIQLERARALGLTGQLRGNTVSSEKIIRQANALYKRTASSNKPDRIAIQRIWSLQAEAAQKASNPELRVKALEKLFSRPTQKDIEFPSSNQPLDLWLAYETLGEELGNRRNLLVGDTAQWQKQAESMKSQNRYGSRAMYALLAMNATGTEHGGQLHGLFYDQLRNADLEHVAVSLYTEQAMFAQVDDIPPAIRHRIVRYAFKKRDISLAADMAHGLSTTFAGQNPVEWNLTRARLAIYSGDFAHGEMLLRDIIAPLDSLSDELADRVMQVLFDLQSVDRFGSAYDLFQMVQQRAIDDDQKREIYFWMADSLKGMEQYDQAAELYIRSASYGKDSFDIWGQTARYHAAEALTQGGMLDDARVMYEGLLRVTSDPARVTALQRKMQDLWLREQNMEGPEI